MSSSTTFIQFWIIIFHLTSYIAWYKMSSEAPYSFDFFFWEHYFETWMEWFYLNVKRVLSDLPQPHFNKRNCFLKNLMWRSAGARLFLPRKVLRKQNNGWLEIFALPLYPEFFDTIKSTTFFSISILFPCLQKCFRAATLLPKRKHPSFQL